MAIELKVPEAGESITEVEIGDWLKKEGDRVERDEALVELQTDKASMELPAPVSGVLLQVLKKSGEIAKVGQVIAIINENGAAKPAAAASAPKEAAKEATKPPPQKESAAPSSQPKQRLSPSARQALREQQSPPPQTQAPVTAKPSAPAPARPAVTGDRPEEVVPMTPIRRKIAERLVEAQKTAALLTTFNEIDMSVVSALRKENQAAFQEKNGIKLGFMSFFVKAAVEALKAIPQINAEIRGTDIVYHNFYDIGVAVSTDKGLIVPVLRQCERLSFAEVEMAIADFGKRARENKLTVDELRGGTFTISNGGIFGSLLSTPIINPPQSGILGMHAIQERPVVRDGQIVIRPMMYVALTYDHRMVDGREAVTFLKRIKELIENPARMLLEV